MKICEYCLFCPFQLLKGSKVQFKFKGAGFTSKLEKVSAKIAKCCEHSNIPNLNSTLDEVHVPVSLCCDSHHHENGCSLNDTSDWMYQIWIRKNVPHGLARLDKYTQD